MMLAISGGITGDKLTGEEGWRVCGMSVVGVEIMFAIRGGIVGDGVAGFKGEVGMVGVLPQASRNRRMSAAFTSGGGEKLGGQVGVGCQVTQETSVVEWTTVGRMKERRRLRRYQLWKD
jgi:hypothetical protein